MSGAMLAKGRPAKVHAIADVLRMAHLVAMALGSSSEHYRIRIDSGITSSEALFSRVTDIAYLGYSSFNGWDAFYDMFWYRLDGSRITVEIDNFDLSGLPDRDRQVWLDLLKDLQQEFPTKLVLTSTDETGG